MALKKKPKEPEKENGERWLVTYSDLITLLLCFFIIMYASASAGAAGGSNGSNGMSEQAVFDAIASAFGAGDSIVAQYSGSSMIDLYSGGETLTNEAIESRAMEYIGQEVNELSSINNLHDSIEVVIDEIGIHIRIKDAVLFNSGSYTINKASESIMLRIGDILKNLPNNKIQVEGHTDNEPINTGIIASNWELGALRAVTVSKMLIRDCAIAPENISAISYGEFQPIGNNKTSEGRAKNRRVEITILRNYEFISQ